MKRRDIKSAVLIIMALLVMMVTACGEDTDTVHATEKEEPKADSGDEMKEYDFSAFENVEY